MRFRALTTAVALSVVVGAGTACGTVEPDTRPPTLAGPPTVAPRAAAPEPRPVPSTGPPAPGPTTPRPVPTRSTPAPPRGALAGTVIVVDAGHNGANRRHPEVINQLVDAYTRMKPCDTTGTQTDDGYQEHAFNHDVAVRLATLLRSAGATVVLTRSSDTGVGPCLTERAAIGNRHRATVAISIHGDGAPAGAHGFHVLEPALIPGAPSTPVVAESHRLAVAVRDQVRRIQPPANYIGQDGINTRDDMGGLNLSRVPKVMVECGNMRSPVDAALMKSPTHRQRLAAALATALTRYLRR